MNALVARLLGSIGRLRQLVPVLLALACVCGALGATDVFAQSAPVIEDYGIDIGAYVEAAATKLGTVYAVVIGAMFAFFVMWRAARGAKKIG